MLAGRTYPVKVTPEEEPLLMKVVKEINDKIKKFQLTYQDSDKQDCLSMALLTYAVEYYKFKDDRRSEEVLQKLDDLEKVVDKML